MTEIQRDISKFAVKIPRFRSVRSITFAAFLIVIALWVKRYLIIVPTLETTLLPMQDLRPEYVKYAATWVEWALTAAGVATFFLMFRLAAKFIPIVPVWETVEYLEEVEEENILSSKREEILNQAKIA